MPTTRCSSPRRRSLSFPVNGGTIPVDLADAGGGSGTWLVNASLQSPHAGVSVSVDDSVSVPGRLAVTATVDHSAVDGDVTGFVTLSRGTDTRRIPFWVEVSHPLLGTEPPTTLTHGGTFKGTTVGAKSLVDHYRYPTAGDTLYPGPEVVYSFKVTQPIANFGVAVLSGHVVPHVVFHGDESHLVGFPGLPDEPQPVSELVRRSTVGRRRDPAGERHLRHRVRHARRSAARAVHVPLLGQRHDPAPATDRLEGAREGRRLDLRPRRRRRPASRSGPRSTVARSSGRSVTAG